MVWGSTTVESVGKRSGRPVFVNGTLQTKVVRGGKGAARPPRKSIPQIGREVHGLQALQYMKNQRDQIEHNMQLHVVKARKGGFTWPQIGAALGVSPQAVQRKYGKFVPQRKLSGKPGG
jgi:hypothetical protein